MTIGRTSYFERIQIYQRDRSCVYDSKENTTSAADVLQELLFGEEVVEKEMVRWEKRGLMNYLKINIDIFRRIEMRGF